MTPQTRAWLLTCPSIEGVSTFAVDLHACRAVDLDALLPRGIAVHVGRLA